MDSYSFTYKGSRWQIRTAGSYPHIEFVPPGIGVPSELSITAACAEILRLAEANQRLARENGGLQALGRLNAALTEERDALKITAEEGQEIIAELSMALAVLAGESLLACADGQCRGHFGPVAAKAVESALAAWRTLQAGNIQAAERVRDVELLLDTIREQAGNDHSLGRELVQVLREQDDEGGNHPMTTLRRIIRERDERAADWKSISECLQRTIEQRDEAQEKLAGSRAAVRALRAALDAVESENRSKCSELAEMAGEIRELQGIVDAAACFVKEVDEVRAVASGDTFDELRKRLAALEVAAPEWALRYPVMLSTGPVSIGKLLALLDSEEPPEGLLEELRAWRGDGCPVYAVSPRVVWRWLREQVHHTGAPGKIDDTLEARDPDRPE